MARPSVVVACIGLGKMGSALAERIQQAGFELVVCNRSAEKTRSFVQKGATAVATPREAAERADAVVTSLFDDASVLEVVSGPDGILAGLHAGAIHIGTTTVSPGASERLAALHREKRAVYLAAPVAGRPEAARHGRLRTFVAGPPDAIERCHPVLRAYASEIVLVGERAGAASSMKLLANFLIASLIEVIGEAYVFGERSGLESGQVQALLEGFLPSPALKVYVEHVGARDFDRPGFTLTAGLKDVGLMLDAAGEARAPLPVASLVRDHMLAALAHDDGQRDWSVLTETLRQEAGAS